MEPSVVRNHTRCLNVWEVLLLSIKHLAKTGRLLRLSPGEIIFRDGDLTYEMFIVLAGAVETYIDRGGKPLVLSRLNQGDFFGEMSVLEEMPRSGSARAVGETILMAINRNNFQKVIREDPDLCWKIMKALSTRIRTLNRELALLSQDRLSVEEEDEEPDNGASKVQPGEDQDTGGAAGASDTAAAANAATPTTPAATAAASVTPAAAETPLMEQVIDDEYYSSKLFSKEVSCPVCQEVFRTKMVRASRLVRVSTDTDFRMRYQDFEPLWFSVWVCPVCYYANYRSEFTGIPDIQRKALMNAKDRRRRDFSPGFGSQRTMKQIIEGYRLVLDCAETIKERDEKVGSLWLNLSWMYEDAGDEARCREALGKALSYLESSYLGARNLSPERLQKLGYLIGEVHRKLGEYTKAREYFYRSINRRAGNPSINTLAEDQLQAVKELLAKQEADQE